MYEGCDGLLVEVQEKILVIKFNRPQKKNAVNRAIYRKMLQLMRQVAEDPNITMVVYTGVGEYYTSGNDLSAAPDDDEQDLETFTKVTLRAMVASFIDCPKLIVCLVNGPCIGIGTTLAGLSDLVWCSEKATFLTPFTKLGIVPEACSSYIFPILMGRSKATEMLLLSEPMTAQEALQFNFASRIYKPSELKEIWEKLRGYSNLPPDSLRISKNLMRKIDADLLHKVLKDECDVLCERFFTEEFFNAVLAFSSRKNKAKL